MPIPGPSLEFRQPPPAPARIHRRALVLAALACRRDLDPHPADAEAEAIHARVRDWLRATGIATELEPAEAALLAAPLGTRPVGATAALGWAAEAAAVLAWGLGLYTLPGLDTPVDATEVGAALGWLDPEAATAIEAARLRPRTDVVLLAEALEVAHAQLLAPPDAPAPSLVNFAPGRRPGARDAAPLSLDAAGRLLIGGQPPGSSTLTPLARALVAERRRAVAWLAGAAPLWSALDGGL